LEIKQEFYFNVLILKLAKINNLSLELFFKRLSSTFVSLARSTDKFLIMLSKIFRSTVRKSPFEPTSKRSVRGCWPMSIIQNKVKMFCKNSKCSLGQLVLGLSLSEGKIPLGSDII